MSYRHVALVLALHHQFDVLKLKSSGNAMRSIMPIALWLGNTLCHVQKFHNKAKLEKNALP